LKPGEFVTVRFHDLDIDVGWVKMAYCCLAVIDLCL